MSLDDIIEAFWQRHRAGVYYPAEWKGKLNLADAYAIQLGLRAKHLAGGRRSAGWKVGLTAPPIQQQFGVHEPVFGYLLDGEAFPSGTAFEAASMVQPGIEVEVCVRLGGEFAGPGATAESARSAVAEVMPALEIPEGRGPFAEDLPMSVVDRVQANGIVLGQARPLSPALSLADVRATVHINGELAATGQGSDVLGDPLNSLAWLANSLADYGLKLESGDLVMTGSFTRQFLMNAGDRVRAELDPLGVVEARFD